MSKLISLVRRAPKRFSAIVLMAVSAVVIPAVVFAWGPERPTFTAANPAPYVTFNSMTDNRDVGDERNFVRVRESGVGNYTDNINVQPGKTYDVMVYYHNNASSGLNASGAGIAKDVMLRMQMAANVPANSKTNIAGFITSSNAKPNEVYDTASITNTTAGTMDLSFVAGSAKVTSNGPVNGQTLPDSVFSTGAPLGFDALNGKVPGCNEYAGYVIFKVKAHQPNFTVSKEVRKKGDATWTETKAVNPSDEIEYLVTYKNTGTTNQNNVVLKDTLPQGVTYIPGTTYVANATNPQGLLLDANSDKATTTGINIGNYAPGAAAYIKFTAKVASNEKLPKCDTNTLVNKAEIQTDNGNKSDTATVTVKKHCKPEKPVKYTCDSLSVSKLTDTRVRFTTAYTVENATFKNVTYVIRNASGAEIAREVSTNTTFDYTQTTPGAYTVEAIVTVTVNGQDKQVSGPKCKKPFEIEKKIVHKYTCDSLKVDTITRTTFRFTTAYTAENATFKSVTYVIRNANNQVVDTINATTATSNYSQTTPGSYTVQATVTFTVDGQDKTVTSDKCKAHFKVEKEKVVKYTCNALEIKSLNRTEFRFSTAYSFENATFKHITYVVRDASGAVVDTFTATTNSSTYTQTTAGAYTVQASVTFTVNGEDKTVTDPKCKGEFKVKDLPKEITVCELATNKIVTIKESEFDSSKYSKNLKDCEKPPVVPETMEVCVIATKETKTINKSDFDASKYTTDFTKCEDTPVVPPELPQTGTTENIVAVVGLGAMIASIAYYAASRRALNQ